LRIGWKTANLHGVSLRPLLENPASQWDRPAITQVRRGNQQKWVFGHSLRTERYRYTMCDEGREGEELYDYETDPRELKNLAKESSAQDLKTKLRARLDPILQGSAIGEGIILQRLFQPVHEVGCVLPVNAIGRFRIEGGYGGNLLLPR
jgi:hypothetical protein